MPDLTTLYAQAGDLIRKSPSPLVFTGAGMSAESGIPTFRDALTGLWARYNPEELASAEAFQADPALVWGFYEERRRTLGRCVPNAGHHALAELERLKPGLTVVTQNVDGFHQQAGNTTVYPLHGDIRKNHCLHGCAGSFETPAEPTPDGLPPECPSCGRRSLRPSVVWFGEMLDPDILQKASDAVQVCDLMVIIGTSGLVYPAAGLAEIAMDSWRTVIEINPEPSAFSHRVNLFIPSPAAAALPAIVSLLQSSHA